MEKIIRKAITKSTRKHIGKTKSAAQRKTKSTAEIKSAIKEKNKLRKTLPQINMDLSM